MKRWVVVAFAVAACAPWTVVQRAEPSPLASQKLVALLPLEWTGVAIDDLSERAWDDTNDAEMKREWVDDRRIAVEEFRNGVAGETGGKFQIAPGAAPLSLKSSVVSLKTGGFRPLYITIRAQLIDARGTVLEEISTTVKENRGRREWGLFRNRLANASRACGANVAEYFAERAQ